MVNQAYFADINPKELRETLALTQAAIHHHPIIGAESKKKHIRVLQQLVIECDRKRPLGPDGTHGDGKFCTPECGCVDYQPVIRTTRYTPIPVRCIEDDLIFRSVREAALHYNTTSSSISKVINGRNKKHQGKTFTRALPKRS